MKKLFVSKNFISKIALILVFLILFQVIAPKPVKALSSMGGALLNPIISLVVFLADGAITVLQTSLITPPTENGDGEEEEATASTDPFIHIDLTGGVDFDFGKWLLGIGVAILGGLAIFFGWKLLVAGKALALIGAALAGAGVNGVVTGVALCFLPNLWDTIEEICFGTSFVFANIIITPEALLKNQIPLFNVNFFTDNLADGATQSLALEIRSIIGGVYSTIRIISLLVMGIVVLYMAIRMLMALSPREKSRYKEGFVNCIVGLVLIAGLHYVMSISTSVIDNITNSIVIGNLIYETNDPNIDVNSIPEEERKKYTSGATIEIEGENLKNALDNEAYKDKVNIDGNKVKIAAANFLEVSRYRAQRIYNADEDGNKVETWDHIGWAFAYIMLVILTIAFTWMYAKRLLYMATLTMLAPIVGVMYPINRADGSRSQSLNLWLKEYMGNLIIQPVHMFLYGALVGGAMYLALNNPIYVIVALMGLTFADKLLRDLLGIQDTRIGGIGNALRDTNRAIKTATNATKEAARKANSMVVGGMKTAANIKQQYDAHKGEAKKDENTADPSNTPRQALNNPAQNQENVKPDGSDALDVPQGDKGKSVGERMLEAYNDKYGTNEWDSQESEAMARELYAGKNGNFGGYTDDEYAQILRDSGYGEDEIPGMVKARRDAINREALKNRLDGMETIDPLTANLDNSVQGQMLDAYDEKFGTDEWDAQESASMARELNVGKNENFGGYTDDEYAQMLRDSGYTESEIPGMVQARHEEMRKEGLKAKLDGSEVLDPADVHVAQGKMLDADNEKIGTNDWDVQESEARARELNTGKNENFGGYTDDQYAQILRDSGYTESDIPRMVQERRDNMIRAGINGKPDGSDALESSQAGENKKAANNIQSSEHKNIETNNNMQDTPAVARTVANGGQNEAWGGYDDEGYANLLRENGYTESEIPRMVQERREQINNAQLKERNTEDVVAARNNFKVINPSLNGESSQAPNMASNSSMTLEKPAYLTDDVWESFQQHGRAENFKTQSGMDAMKSADGKIMTMDFGKTREGGNMPTPPAGEMAMAAGGESYSAPKIRTTNNGTNKVQPMAETETFGGGVSFTGGVSGSGNTGGSVHTSNLGTGALADESTERINRSNLRVVKGSELGTDALDANIPNVNKPDLKFVSTSNRGHSTTASIGERTGIEVIEPTRFAQDPLERVTDRTTGRETVTMNTASRVQDPLERVTDRTTGRETVTMNTASRVQDPLERVADRTPGRETVTMNTQNRMQDPLEIVSDRTPGRETVTMNTTNVSQSPLDRVTDRTPGRETVTINTSNRMQDPLERVPDRTSDRTTGRETVTMNTQNRMQDPLASTPQNSQPREATMHTNTTERFVQGHETEAPQTTQPREATMHTNTTERFVQGRETVAPQTSQPREATRNNNTTERFVQGRETVVPQTTQPREATMHTNTTERFVQGRETVAPQTSQPREATRNNNTTERFVQGRETVASQTVTTNTSERIVQEHETKTMPQRETSVNNNTKYVQESAVVTNQTARVTESYTVEEARINQGGGISEPLGAQFGNSQARRTSISVDIPVGDVNNTATTRRRDTQADRTAKNSSGARQRPDSSKATSKEPAPTKRQVEEEQRKIAEAQAREEIAARKAAEEQQRKAREEAERKAKEQAQKAEEARKAAIEKAKKEAEEAQRKAEQERKEREEAERKAIEDAEREEAEKKAEKEKQMEKIINAINTVEPIAQTAGKVTSGLVEGVLSMAADAMVGDVHGVATDAIGAVTGTMGNVSDGLTKTPEKISIANGEYTKYLVGQGIPEEHARRLEIACKAKKIDDRRNMVLVGELQKRTNDTSKETLDLMAKIIKAKKEGHKEEDIKRMIERNASGKLKDELLTLYRKAF